MIANSSSGSSGAATLTVTAGGLFAGTIQDGGLGGNATTGLMLSGGTLTLSGSNTYSGGTIVSGGGLIVANAYSLLDGSNLTVGNANAFAAPVISASAPVPEPGTLMLAAVALWSAMACHRFSQRLGKPIRTSPPVLKSEGKPSHSKTA